MSRGSVLGIIDVRLVRTSVSVPFVFSVMDNLSLEELLKATEEDLFYECERRGLRLTQNPLKFEAAELIRADNVRNQTESGLAEQSRATESDIPKLSAYVPLNQKIAPHILAPRIVNPHRSVGRMFSS